MPAPSRTAKAPATDPRPFGIPEADYRRAREVLARHPCVTAAMVYGSRATGRHRPGSDIDLALVGAISREELLAIAAELDDLLLPYTFDLSLLDHIRDPRLRAHIETDGRVFYPGAAPPGGAAD
ncbi:MAG: nucleotidyltransferase domain-containing protein [Gammaproteobacteria bacterium]|nr:nucleotidyltransferase domain-containing protein [Gammaproteobacteria bacterium]